MLTLFTTPVIYLYLDKMRWAFSRNPKHRAGTTESQARGEWRNMPVRQGVGSQPSGTRRSAGRREGPPMAVVRRRPAGRDSGGRAARVVAPAEDGAAGAGPVRPTPARVQPVFEHRPGRPLRRQRNLPPLPQGRTRLLPPHRHGASMADVDLDREPRDGSRRSSSLETPLPNRPQGQRHCGTANCSGRTRRRKYSWRSIPSSTWWVRGGTPSPTWSRWTASSWNRR